MKDLNVVRNKYEDLFWGGKAKDLTSIFKNFLYVKVESNVRNFYKLNIRLSSVVNILQLKYDLYYLMGNNLDPDFIVSDDEFQDFFESFIVFTRRIFLKQEADYEDDIFDINEYRGDIAEIDNDFDIDGINEIIDNSSESD